jgi:murein DD-endopeptidase MepM/ murein hydrolase activator NlpD
VADGGLATVGRLLPAVTRRCLAALAVVGVGAFLLASALPAARSLVAYRQEHAALATLLAERRTLAATLEAAIAREQGTLARLDAVEALLADHLAEREALLAGDAEPPADRSRLDGLDVEIARLRREADQLAGDAGRARAQALRVSRRLADLHSHGSALAAVIAALLAPPLDPPWPQRTLEYRLPAGTVAFEAGAPEPLALSSEAAVAARRLSPDPIWSWPVAGTITTAFGQATPYQPAHFAIDIGAPLYAPVLAAAGGQVEFAGLAAPDNRLASYGAVVVVRHSERLASIYAHLDDRAYGLAVRRGEEVRQGQLLGYVGLTGYTTGPHLHFEARLDGRPIDPLLLVGSPPPSLPSG